jgi:hypothetical protein
MQLVDLVLLTLPCSSAAASAVSPDHVAQADEEQQQQEGGGEDTTKMKAWSRLRWVMSEWVEQTLVLGLDLVQALVLLLVVRRSRWSRRVAADTSAPYYCW